HIPLERCAGICRTKCRPLSSFFCGSPHYGNTVRRESDLALHEANGLTTYRTIQGRLSFVERRPLGLVPLDVPVLDRNTTDRAVFFRRHLGGRLGKPVT